MEDYERYKLTPNLLSQEKIQHLYLGLKSSRTVAFDYFFDFGDSKYFEGIFAFFSVPSRQQRTSMKTLSPLTKACIR